jgi:tetratricopeptide (TPR) repeat protein
MTTRARALERAGVLAWRQGDSERADALAAEAVDLARALSDRPALEGGLNLLGLAARSRGDYATALAYHEEALAVARESGERWALAHATWLMGSTLARLGRHAEARPLLEEALVLHRDMGHHQGAHHSLASLGIAAIGEGDVPRARALFGQAREQAEQGGWWRVLGSDDTHLGLIARLERDLGAARQHYTAGLTRSRDAGDRPSILWSLEEWAGLAIVRGQGTRAARLLGAAEALREAMALPQQPYLRPFHEQDLAALRATMDEASLAVAWAAGRALTLEQAIAEALADEGEPDG